MNLSFALLNLHLATHKLKLRMYLDLVLYYTEYVVKR